MSHHKPTYLNAFVEANHDVEQYRKLKEPMFKKTHFQTRKTRKP